MPSDADLMKIAIADLKNSSISLKDRQRALQELLILFEPLDNANGKSAPFLVHLYGTCCSAYKPKYLLISTENCDIQVSVFRV